MSSFEARPNTLQVHCRLWASGVSATGRKLERAGAPVSGEIAAAMLAHKRWPSTAALTAQAIVILAGYKSVMQPSELGTWASTTDTTWPSLFKACSAGRLCCRQCSCLQKLPILSLGSKAFPGSELKHETLGGNSHFQDRFARDIHQSPLPNDNCDCNILRQTRPSRCLRRCGASSRPPPETAKNLAASGVSSLGKALEVRCDILCSSRSLNCS